MFRLSTKIRPIDTKDQLIVFYFESKNITRTYSLCNVCYDETSSVSFVMRDLNHESLYNPTQNVERDIYTDSKSMGADELF